MDTAVGGGGAPRRIPPVAFARSPSKGVDALPGFAARVPVAFRSSRQASSQPTPARARARRRQWSTVCRARWFMFSLVAGRVRACRLTPAPRGHPSRVVPIRGSENPRPVSRPRSRGLEHTHSSWNKPRCSRTISVHGSRLHAAVFVRSRMNQVMLCHSRRFFSARLQQPIFFSFFCLGTVLEF